MLFSQIKLGGASGCFGCALLSCAQIPRAVCMRTEDFLGKNISVKSFLRRKYFENIRLAVPFVVEDETLK